MLKNTGSDIFDEAYFVIKENTVTSTSVSENDMIAEANKILNENRLSEYCMKSVRKNHTFKKFILPLCILASVGIITAVIILTVIIIRM